MTPPGPLAAVGQVLLANLVPLVLVLNGNLDLADLVVCYAVETSVIALFFVGTNAGLRGAAAVVVVPLVLGVRALTRVTWDVASVLAIVLTVAVTVGLLVLARRRAGRTPDAPIGAYGWRLLVLLVGGVVGLSYADDLEVLVDAGWTPENLRGAPTDALATLLNRLVVGIDLPPVYAAAIMLVAFKALNETLFALYGVLRERARGTTSPAAD